MDAPLGLSWVEALLIEPDNLTTRRLTAASSLSFLVKGEKQLQETPRAHPCGKPSSSAKQLTWPPTKHEALSLAHRGVGDVLVSRVVAVCDTIHPCHRVPCLILVPVALSLGIKPHFMLHLNLTRPIVIMMETTKSFDLLLFLCTACDTDL